MCQGYLYIRYYSISDKQHETLFSRIFYICSMHVSVGSSYIMNEHLNSMLLQMTIFRLGYCTSTFMNPLIMDTLKLQSNGPLHSNMILGTLAANGQARAPPSPLLAVPNHPSYYLILHYNYRCPLKG